MAIATEQIVVELVADTSSLESAIDQLARTGAIDSQLASAFKTTTAEINKQAQAVGSVSANLTKQTQQFQGLNAAIKPVAGSIQTLTDSYNKQGQAANSIKQVSTELNKQAEAVEAVNQNAAPAATSLEDLAFSAKNLSKSMMEGIQQGIVESLQQAGVSIDQFTQRLTGIKGTASFDALNKSLTQTALRAAETATKLDELKNSGQEGSEGFVALQKQLEADTRELEKIQDQLTNLSGISGTFDGLADGSDRAARDTVSLRTELRNLVDDIARAKSRGEDYGQHYEELVEHAAHLRQALSHVNREVAEVASDTKNITGLIEVARGVAGAFEVAEGATALFGGESENLQRTMVRLQATMATLQGFQEISNALSKDSAASLFLNSVATKAQIAAQKTYNLVVGTSTGALKAFRIALASTGIGLLVIALGALIANWDKVKQAIGGVSDAQKHLSETAGLNAEAAEEGLQAIEDSEESLKRQGLTEEDILKKKIAQTGEVIKFREQQLQAQIEMTKGQIEAAERNKNILAGIITFLTLPLKGLQIAINKIAEFLGSDIRIPDLGESLASQIFNPDDVKKAGEKSIAEAQKIIDKEKNQQDGLSNSLDAKQKEDARKRADAAKAANEQRLKDAISAIEAELLAVQKGSEKELELQKKLLTAKANLDLSGAKSAAERRLIAEKLNADLAQLDIDAQNSRTQTKIKGIQDELDAVKEGSQKELELRKQLIDQQAALELNSLNITQAEKDRIEKKRFNDKLKLERDFNKKLAAEAIQNQISINNAALANLQTNEEQRLLLQISNIELAAEQEVAAANGNAAKIKEIYANRDAAIRDTKIRFIEEAVEFEIAETRRAEAAIRGALQKTADNNQASFGDRISAVQDLTKIEIAEIEKRMTALNQESVDGLISLKDYNKKYGELAEEKTKKTQEEEDKITALIGEQAAARLKVAFAAAQAIADVFSMIADFQAAKDEERIAGMKKVLADEIAAGAITEKEAAARQKRIDAEEKKARIKAAERAKQIAIFNSIINTAQAIVQALASAPPPFNFVLAGIVGAMGLAQTALIASKPIPKFKTGKKHLYEGPGQVGEAGTEIIERNGTMYVVDKPTITWLGSKDKVYTPIETKQILKDKPAYKVNKEAMIPLNGNNGMDKLMNELQALHKTMKSKNGVTVNIDKEGITEFFEKTMSEIHYFNNRYTFRNK